MDTLDIPSQFYVAGRCDGASGSPTPADIALVQQLYSPDAFAAGALRNLGPDFEMEILDLNLGAWGYAVWIYRDMAGSWVAVDGFDYVSNIAPRDIHLKFYWRGSTADTYLVCYPYSAIYAAEDQQCSQVELAGGLQHDSDGDGTSDVKEAGTPACDDAADSDGGEPGDVAVNDGCPVYRGFRELPGFGECLGDTDDDLQDGDGLVNDGCPVAGGNNYSEALIRTGTDPSRHCAATIAANDELVDSHPMDFNDDRRTNLSDVVIMGVSFNKLAGDPAYNPRYDLNTSGSVNLSDTVLLGPYCNQPACTP
jgi:hypothetical protein